ncbi:MAG TPA: hypothetical protein PLZ55_05120 [bacterium]|nr:hypothetical protein [bacterium]
MRQIIKTAPFQAEYVSFAAEFARAGEFITGAEYSLGRNPYLGDEIQGNPPVRIYRFFDVRGKKNAVLYYTFDENRVIFLSIRLSDRS